MIKKIKGEDKYLILRTVYLPSEIDDAVRRKAFESNRTMNSLIREAVEIFIQEQSNK